MLLRLITATTLVLAGWFAGAAPALADSQTSSNWSGYAAHGKGVHFRRVSGEWRVPAVSCRAKVTTYSAMWVGLGGFSTTSDALEQTGTEADCNGARPHYNAWYELVPGPSHTLALNVRAGDLMRALVVVAGHRVTLQLSDRTRHRSFTRTFTDSVPDTSSAEWILEAPGDCSDSRCVTLPLSNFHRAVFSLAHVVTVSGRSGTITNGHWRTTRITLGPPATPGSATFTGGASPSALSAAGSAFSLRYTAGTITAAAVHAAAVASDRLMH